MSAAFAASPELQNITGCRRVISAHGGVKSAGLCLLVLHARHVVSYVDGLPRSDVAGNIQPRDRQIFRDRIPLFNAAMPAQMVLPPKKTPGHPVTRLMYHQYKVLDKRKRTSYTTRDSPDSPSLDVYPSLKGGGVN